MWKIFLAIHYKNIVCVTLCVQFIAIVMKKVSLKKSRAIEFFFIFTNLEISFKKYFVNGIQMNISYRR